VTEWIGPGVSLLASLVAVVAFAVRADARLRNLDELRREQREADERWRARIEEKLDRLSAQVNRLAGILERSGHGLDG
jgi:hypothetical protein